MKLVLLFRWFGFLLYHAFQPFFRSYSFTAFSLLILLFRKLWVFFPWLSGCASSCAAGRGLSFARSSREPCRDASSAFSRSDSVSMTEVCSDQGFDDSSPSKPLLVGEIEYELLKSSGRVSSLSAWTTWGRTARKGLREGRAGAGRPRMVTSFARVTRVTIGDCTASETTVMGAAV